ncbi:MAG: hypothetical protein AB7S38_28840 [Vulcanimicrobiota bacterium]
MNTQTKLNNLREVLIHVTNLLAEVDLQRLLEWPAGPEVATADDPWAQVLELQTQFARVCAERDGWVAQIRDICKTMVERLETDLATAGDQEVYVRQNLRSFREILAATESGQNQHLARVSVLVRNALSFADRRLVELEPGNLVEVAKAQQAVLDQQRAFEWKLEEVTAERDRLKAEIEAARKWKPKHRALAARHQQLASERDQWKRERDLFFNECIEVENERDTLAARVEELEVSLGESKPEANSLRKVMERAASVFETECRYLTNRNIELANERDDLAGKLALVQECFRRIDKLFLLDKAFSLDEYKLCLGLGDPEALKPAPHPTANPQEPAFEAGPGGSETQVPGPEGIGATLTTDHSQRHADDIRANPGAVVERFEYSPHREDLIRRADVVSYVRMCGGVSSRFGDYERYNCLADTLAEADDIRVAVHGKSRDLAAVRMGINIEDARDLTLTYRVIEMLPWKAVCHRTHNKVAAVSAELAVAELRRLRREHDEAAEISDANLDTTDSAAIADDTGESGGQNSDANAPPDALNTQNGASGECPHPPECLVWTGHTQECKPVVSCSLCDKRMLARMEVE